MLSRVFLGWDDSVPALAARHLSQGWGGGPLDLSSVLVVVPTLHSGRRLRKSLALAAAARRSAVFPPAVWTPDRLLAGAEGARAVPSRVETVAIWARLLADGAARDFPEVLGPAAGARTAGHLLAAAQRLADLRDALGENGLMVRDVADRLASLDSPERWEALTRLEALYLERLDALGLADRTQARVEAAGSPTLPDTARFIVVMAVPDPIPLSLAALESASRRMPVTVCVHAPADLADLFDAWGRPLTSAWKDRRVDIESRNIRLAGRPSDQAGIALRIVTDERFPLPDLAIGVPDPDVLPHLEDSPSVAVHNPAGVALRGHALCRALDLLASFFVDSDFKNFAQISRNSYFHNYLRQKQAEFDVPAFLRQLDSVQNEHLPEDAARLRVLAAAPGRERLACALGLLDRLLEAFKRERLSDALRDLMADLLDGRMLDSRSPDDSLLAQAGRTLADALDRLDSPVLDACGLEPGERLQLLFLSLDSLRVYPEQPAEGVDLAGWLELPYEDASCLIVTGMNDGKVPETLVSDLFLPDSARTLLGLRDNDTRLARDAFLLTGMLAWRTGRGSVHLVVGKTSGSGDPLKPSRLLFRCPDALLPGRTSALFGEPETVSRPAERTRVFRLVVPAARIPQRLGVTALADYVECPFQFYLKHVLRLESVDDRKVELDAMDFGSVCHEALEALSLPGTRDERDAVALGDSLEQRARAWFRERFGRHLPAALLVQQDSVCARLRAAARIEAELRREGWRTVAAEQKVVSVPETFGSPIVVSGKIDRIDRHPSGRIRLVDYKTSDTAALPEERHAAPVRPGTPDYALWERNGRQVRFRDLQLPLYRLLVADRFPERVECAYFNLPKAAAEAGLAVWTDLDDATLEAAARCVRGILADVGRRRFWPPRAREPFPEFEHLFFGPVEECVDVAASAAALGIHATEETR